jgi:NNMT/PNMT/TEMT family
MRALLRRSLTGAFASFEVEWVPQRYLADYYGAVEPDERHTIAYLVRAARDLPPSQSVLVFGAGPTLHHAFPFADRARVIDFSDVLPGNMQEIRHWISSERAPTTGGPSCSTRSSVPEGRRQPTPLQSAKHRLGTKSAGCFPPICVGRIPSGLTCTSTTSSFRHSVPTQRPMTS